MNQKIILILLALLMCGISGKAQKKDFGNGVFWELREGALTISGSGIVPEPNSPLDYPWDTDKVNKIIIDKGITAIKSNAFGFCRNLTSVEIANTVNNIEIYAFVGCNNLKSVTIPWSIKEINHLAFSPSTTIYWSVEDSKHLKYYIVIQNGKKGLIHADGKEIIPIELNILEPAGIGYLRFYVNGYAGIMNFAGKVIIPTDRGYTWIGDYVSITKRFPYEMDGYKGECNHLGQQVTKIKDTKPKPSTHVPSASSSSSSSSSNSSASTTSSSSTTYSSNSNSGNSTTTVVVEQHGPVQVWVPCGGCQLSPGRCSYCNGSGWGYNNRLCSRCNGTGKCTICNGTGGHNEVQYR